MKIENEKQAIAALSGFVAFCIALGAGKAAKTGKGKPKKEELADDDLDVGGETDDDLSLDDGDDAGNDDLDLGEDAADEDPRYNELRGLLTKLAKATKSKDLGYKILAKFDDAQDVDAVSKKHLDNAVKLAKAQLAKISKK